MVRRLAAILAADVIGYSAMMGADETRALAAIRRLREELFEPEVARWRGTVVKRLGDGWLVEFASVVDAVDCAIAVQVRMADAPGVELRIGVHIGDIVFEDGDIYGEGVNIAARLEAKGAPGHVVISDDARRQITGRVEATFHNNGPVTLKNIAEPVQVWSWPEALPALVDLSDRDGRKPAIHVARFEARGAEAEDMAAAMRDDLSTMFSRQTALILVSDESKADYVVAGAVRASGARWRITAQLTERASDRRVWSARYDESGDDVFDIHDRCGFQIASAVRIRISYNESQTLVGRRPEDLTIEELLNLAARHFMSPTCESFTRAASLLEIALARDADNWMAMSMLSFYTMRRQELGWRAITRADADRTLSLIEHALRLSPNSDVVRMTRAKALLFVNHDHRAARVEVEQALKLNSNYIRSIVLLAQIEAYDGNADKAVALARQAVDGDPGHPHLYTFLRQAGVTFSVVGDFIGAAEMFMRADLVAPALPSNLIGLAACRRLAGDADGARTAMATLLDAAPAFNLAELAPWPFRDAENWVPFHDALAAAGGALQPSLRVVEGGAPPDVTRW